MNTKGVFPSFFFSLFLSSLYLLLLLFFPAKRFALLGQIQSMRVTHNITGVQCSRTVDQGIQSCHYPRQLPQVILTNPLHHGLSVLGSLPVRCSGPAELQQQPLYMSGFRPNTLIRSYFLLFGRRLDLILQPNTHYSTFL